MKKWWHDKIVYQIYPKSFFDSNGDGIGDIQGIIQKLDYIKSLGADILWICPMYPSPMADQGYDISDYYNIDPTFGTLDDMDRLISESKKRGMYVIMDLVVNHCSDEHEWFRKACQEPGGKYGKYFYIEDIKDGKLPCNWRGIFGGSVWSELPGHPGKVYLHTFHKKQPDLNWENPKVRQEIYKMVNWWLDKGLAGFRIDAIINIKKDLAFPVMEPDGDDGLASCWRMVENAEGVDALLEDLKNHTFAKKDAFTVGEVFNIGVEDLPDFIGENGHFSTIFDFSAHMLSDGKHGWYDAPPISFDAWKKAITDSQMRVQNVGFEANIIENHDEPRGVSRFLPDYAQNADGAKMLGTVSVLLRGIPFIYQGQEIGMQNARWNSVDEFDDISTKDQYRMAREAGLSDAEALAVCSVMSRDNARTPMQWKDAPQAGFTSGTPWLKVNDNYPVINVEKEEEQPDSVLHYYRKLIALRKSEEYRELFTYGKFEPAYENADHVMAYYRILQGRRVLVAANFGTDTIELDWEVPAKKVLLSNKKRTNAENKLILEKCEVFVTECK